MEIVLAEEKDLSILTQGLDDCVLGAEYFSDSDYRYSFFKDSFDKGELYTAKDAEGNVIGSMRIDFIAAFGKFPLLRLITILPEYRNKGLGSDMIKQYEELSKNKADKVFLFVSEFNAKAKSLYEKLGYTQVGTIPDLYKKGCTEYLMYKVL